MILAQRCPSNLGMLTDSLPNSKNERLTNRLVELEKSLGILVLDRIIFAGKVISLSLVKKSCLAQQSIDLGFFPLTWIFASPFSCYSVRKTFSIGKDFSW